MTVADYFSTHRDEHGRAWLSQHCWIEYGVGCFRLNTPTEEISLIGSVDVGVAVAIVAQVLPPQVDEASDGEVAVGGDVDGTVDGTTQDDDAMVTEEAGASIDASGDDVADQFDDFHGVGAWPGAGADDAEASDFEDSVGDIGEALDEDSEEE